MRSRQLARRGAPWSRADGPVLSVFQQGDRARLDFDYSPARVSAIKALKGARFNAEEKSWSVPVAQVSQLLALREFPPNRVLRALPEIETLPAAPEVALLSLRENPFHVTGQIFASGVVDVVVRFNATKRRVVIVPRFGGAGYKIIKKNTAISFSGMDHGYTVSPVDLPGLLKTLRDKRVSFGVTEETSTNLRESVELRQEIVKSPELFTSDDLSRACLTPFITEVTASEARYRPCFFTPEQFKIAFPGLHRTREDAPLLLDLQTLVKFASRRAQLPFKVWITRGVRDAILEGRGKILQSVRAQAGPIDDEAADAIDLPIIWRVNERIRGTLCITMCPGDERRALLLECVSRELQTKYPSESEALRIEVPDSRLLAVYRSVSELAPSFDLGEVPRSVSFERLLADIGNREELRRTAERFSHLRDVPASEIRGLDSNEASRLFPHQRVAVQWLKAFPFAFLGDDMGLGKTLSVLSGYRALVRDGVCNLLLVICPNSLTRNWAREVSAWYPDLKPIVLSGDKAEKEWALRILLDGSSQCDVFIVNYEAVRLPYISDQLQKLAANRETFLCLDESQRAKNHQSKSFKAISAIAPHCSRRVLLSGTPTPKDVSDLWAQMRILDGGERFGKSFYRWLGTIAELGNEFSQFAVKSFNEPEVKEAMYRAHELMLRRKKESVTDLPPKTFSIREIEMSGSQRERYSEIRDGLILRMRSTSGEQFVRDIDNILEEYLRAVQVASNPRLIDPQWKGTPAKFTELDEIVNEVVRENGQKLVVWTNYLGNVSELVARYSDVGAAPYSGEVTPAVREQTVRAFQQQETPKILVAVPAAGGVGITLTAAQTSVYLDKTWNAEHWMQSVDRIHRIGQTGTVNVISLLGCKVDHMIHWNLRRKERVQAEVLGDTPATLKASAGHPTREELLEALEGV